MSRLIATVLTLLLLTNLVGQAGAAAASEKPTAAHDMAMSEMPCEGKMAMPEMPETVDDNQAQPRGEANCCSEQQECGCYELCNPSPFTAVSTTDFNPAAKTPPPSAANADNHGFIRTPNLPPPIVLFSS